MLADLGRGLAPEATQGAQERPLAPLHSVTGSSRVLRGLMESWPPAMVPTHHLSSSFLFFLLRLGKLGSPALALSGSCSWGICPAVGDRG